MEGPIGATGSPERRAWAAAETAGAPGGRSGKRGPDRIGGATAPLPIGSIATPPAQRRRVSEFTLTAPDLEGQMEEFIASVKEEFGRV